MTGVSVSSLQRECTNSLVIQYMEDIIMQGHKVEIGSTMLICSMLYLANWTLDISSRVAHR